MGNGFFVFGANHLAIPCRLYTAGLSANNKHYHLIIRVPDDNALRVCFGFLPGPFGPYLLNYPSGCLKTNDPGSHTVVYRIYAKHEVHRGSVRAPIPKTPDVRGQAFAYFLSPFETGHIPCRRDSRPIASNHYSAHGALLLKIAALLECFERPCLFLNYGG